MKRIATGLMALFLLVALGFGVNAAQASAAPAQVSTHTQAVPSFAAPTSTCCYRSTRYCYPSSSQFPGTWFRVSSWYTNTPIIQRTYHVGIRSSWDGGTFSWSTWFQNFKVGGVTYRSSWSIDYPQYYDFYWNKKYTYATSVAKIYVSWDKRFGGASMATLGCTMTGA